MYEHGREGGGRDCGVGPLPKPDLLGSLRTRVEGRWREHAGWAVGTRGDRGQEGGPALLQRTNATATPLACACSYSQEALQTFGKVHSWNQKSQGYERVSCDEGDLPEVVREEP